MSRIVTLTRSFAGGEITPELFGRIDLSKYQTGLKTCQNFQILPHGVVVNSPGFEYILETKNSAKKSVLIPFIFNTSQAYQLEFGDQYIRFHTQAGTVLEAQGAITNITQANPGVVTHNAHGYVNGQWVFLSGITGMTQLNGRFAVVAGAAANTYQLTYFDGSNINTTAYGAFGGAGFDARVYEIASPYLEADLQDLHYVQSADVLTVTHVNYDKRELKRLGATNWTLNAISLAQIQVPEAKPFLLTPTGGGTPTLQEYLVSFAVKSGLEESKSYIPSYPSTAGLNTLTNITIANPAVFTTGVAHGFVIGQPVLIIGCPGVNGYFDFFVGVVNTVPLATTFTLRDYITGTNVSTLGLSAFGGGVVGNVFVLNGWIQNATLTNPGVFTTNVAHGYIVNDPIIMDGLIFNGVNTSLEGIINSVPTPTTFTLKDAVTGVAIDTSGFGAPYTALTGLAQMKGVYNDLTVAGHSNKIRLMPAPLPPSTTYLRYYIYKKINGLYGFIGASSLPGIFIDNNISPSFAQTPPIPNDPLSTANNYPGEVSYWQGRRWFAGSLNVPQGLFATRSGTESNMTYSIPGVDSDSISVQLKARRADRILHMIPITDLVLLTSGGEWKVNGGNGVAVTPSSLSYTPEDYIGASNVRPIVTGGAVLYPQAMGCRIRELLFVWQQQGYKASDISVMAPHLFDGFTIQSSAYCRAPYSFGWWVRSDGVLLGLTYVQEQQVAAWHHRTTTGSFESVCATPEGTEDVLYAIVKRTVNGRTVRYFERQRSRQMPTLASSFFVDAGSTYNGAPATSITGFYHLEGQAVSVLADGALVTGRTIVNGAISPALDVAASIVSAGLGYNCDLETLPLSSESIAAGGQGATKNVDEVILRVNQSASVFIGPSLSKTRELKIRTNEPYGSPPNLLTGIARMKIDPSWNEDGGIAIRQPNPLPISILSLSLKVAIGG